MSLPNLVLQLAEKPLKKITIPLGMLLYELGLNKLTETLEKKSKRNGLPT